MLDAPTKCPLLGAKRSVTKQPLYQSRFMSTRPVARRFPRRCRERRRVLLVVRAVRELVEEPSRETGGRDAGQGSAASASPADTLACAVRKVLAKASETPGAHAWWWRSVFGACSRAHLPCPSVWAIIRRTFLACTYRTYAVRVPVRRTSCPWLPICHPIVERILPLPNSRRRILKIRCQSPLKISAPFSPYAGGAASLVPLAARSNAASLAGYLEHGFGV